MYPLCAKIIGFLCALIFAALFAFLETAFTALRFFKLKELKKRVARYHTLFSSWEKNPQRILITILIANNFAHVVTSVLITEIMQCIVGQGFGLIIGIAIATIMILILGEIIPKNFARVQHEKLFASLLWLMALLFWTFYPFVTILLKISNFFYENFGGKTNENSDVISEREIEFLIDYSDEKGIMESEKTGMLQNIFDLATKYAVDILVPKTDMISLNVSVSLNQALEFFAKHRYSRLPVYAYREENIIGIIYQKDILMLLLKQKTKCLQELVRPVLFVPQTKKINQLLSEFLKKRMHMAIVIDEYGAIVGLVTLEDVIEEIVGDISDEDEKIHHEIVPLEKGRWLIDARTSLEKLSEFLSIPFKTKESVTLAGFLAEELQHLPGKGERISYHGYCFQVQQANRRRVFQVLVFEDKNQST